MSRPLQNDTVNFTNITATPDPFPLRGGLYAISSKGTWGGGSITLQRLALDGATYLTVTPAITADGYTTVTLPPGTYRLVVATATALYVEIIGIVIGV